MSSSPEPANNITLVAQLIKNSRHAVALTGAGISTPSGIPDFRSPGVGLWTRYEPMEVASLSAFRYHPDKFYAWLHPLASQVLAAQPNAAHFALAQLQASNYLGAIITQNIDGLHKRSGARDVLEVHGTMNSLTCIECFKQVASDGVILEFIRTAQVPRCQECGGILKPDVILYEEQLPVKTWQKAEQACRSCDLMLVVGTSLEVMPSAKLPLYVLDHGGTIAIINQSETYVDVRAQVLIRGDAAEILPEIVEAVVG